MKKLEIIQDVLVVFFFHFFFEAYFCFFIGNTILKSSLKTFFFFFSVNDDTLLHKSKLDGFLDLFAVNHTLVWACYVYESVNTYASLVWFYAYGL